MDELRPSGSRGYLRAEPILRSSASQTSSSGTRCEEQVDFSGIKIGDSQNELEPNEEYEEIRRYIRDPGGYIIEVGQSTNLT